MVNGTGASLEAGDIAARSPLLLPASALELAATGRDVRLCSSGNTARARLTESEIVAPSLSAFTFSSITARRRARCESNERDKKAPSSRREKTPPLLSA